MQFLGAINFRGTFFNHLKSGHRMNILEKNSYKIDNDVLTIRTICGEYSFKVEESGSTDNIHRIAQMMVSEMVKAEKSVSKTGVPVNPHVLVLLANLNLSKKYVEMRDRLDTLNQTLEKKTRTLGDVKPKAYMAQQTSQVPIPKTTAETHTPPPVAKMPPGSGIVDNQQKINTSLSDPIARKYHMPPPLPEKPDIPSPQPANVPEPAKIPEPVKTPALAKASATTNSLQPIREPGRDPEAEPMSETHGMHQNPSIPSSVQKTVSTDPHFPGTSSTEVSNRSNSGDVCPEAKDIVPESINDTPDVAMTAPEPINEVPGVEMTVPEAADVNAVMMPDSMQTSDADIESENSLSKTIAAQQKNTMGDTSMLKTGEEKNLTCHAPPPPMGNFPIHTAVTYSHVEINSSPIEKKSTQETYQLPPLGFLKNIDSKTEVDHESIRRDAELLEKKLGYFGIKGEVMGVSPGPVITTFEYKPDPGIKISKIVNLADDLALALSAYSIRIVAPIPGKDVMGIEIPNLKKSIVPFIDIVSSEDFINSTSKLPICLGKDIIGNPVVVALESMPHLLIAGATGTGKSVGLNAMITSILYKANPDEVKFLMIDPKRIELSLYNDIPHLITPVITDMKKATTALQWMVREMERRYDLLAKYQVRNIEQFNQKIKNMDSAMEEDEAPPEPLSYIVIIIDELADLMMTASRDVELSLTRLAQMARAAGIHLILATQRPSVDVLTGIIKANFPTRISFQVSSKTDSRTIIDSNGAETLLGMGDMLFVPPGTARLTRVHGTYLSEDELIEVTTFLKAQQTPNYLFDVITEQQEESEQEYQNDEYDEKYQDALEVVMATRQASISGIQRALRVGYNRAARIIDIMEKKGIVGPSDGAKPRQVLTGPMD
jgi:DNA segregation ATPase FtsK/SpoIIIE-like protein